MAFNIEPREKIASRKPLQHREKIEFIIDSCSANNQIFEAVNKLVEYTENSPINIYNEYRIILPIQIGTERKLRIFPEFLDAELRGDKAGDLENFYQRHRAQILLVETPTSRAFKLYYAFKALDILKENSEIKTSVLAEAQKLAQRYSSFFGIDASRINSIRFDTFLMRIQQAHDSHYCAMKEPTLHIIANKRDLVSDENIARTVRKAEHKLMAREAKPFLEELSIEDKLLLQAMYSNNELNRAISKLPDFKRYRMDKGERAIEEFLFTKRSESDPSRVTIVISEDQGARKQIQHLREKSHNTIFAISSYGLARAMCALFPSMNLLDMLKPHHIETIQLRDAKTEIKIRNGQSINMNDLIEPRIEEKWADRLAEVIKKGRWEDSPEMNVEK